MFARCVTRSIASELTSLKPRFYATESKRSRDFVKIVEVGPRDGLQNEKTIIPPQIKAELVNRLSKAGIDIIESGSFVSPKWVPQMAGTAEVLSAMKRVPGHHYPVLVPNMKGLEALLALLSSQRRTDVPFTDEIAVFTAATDAFCKANTNCTVPESLNRLREVTKHALAHGLRVRGYVSVVIDCPYSGKVDPVKVKEVSRMLIEMGCYEVSLGDTVGTGSPTTVNEMLHTVIHGDGGVSPSKLAGHFHDTYGMGVANVLTALKHGLRTFDSAVGGLGGCPYSPGATGNVATEDVLYALRGSAYETSGNIEAVAEVGSWISHKLGRPNASRVGRALEARKDRERERYKEATQNVAAKL